MAMIVKCKHCGASNQREPDQYVVKCASCGKKTSYLVQPNALKKV